MFFKKEFTKERLKALPRLIWNLAYQHPAARKHWGLPLIRFIFWKIRKNVWLKPMIVTVEDQMVFKLYPEGSHAANHMYYYGLYEWNEMRFLQFILKPGDVFLDVGANVGVYSILAAKQVAPNGKVIAIEPDKNNASRLKENFSLNQFSENMYEVHQVAVGAESGKCLFDCNDAIGRVTSHASSAIETPMITLDSLQLDIEYFTVGKMDIEGYELLALQGAKHLLTLGRPYCWLIETNDECAQYGTSRKMLYEFLATYGYKMYRVEKQGLQLQEIIPDVHSFPANSIAINDIEWLRTRAPQITVINFNHEGKRSGT